MGATLGGMVNNPDRGDSYVPTTSSARYLPPPWPPRLQWLCVGERGGCYLRARRGQTWLLIQMILRSGTNTNSTDSVSLTEYSPDGSLATELSEDTSSSVYHQISFSNSTLTGTTYTFSAYVKLASGSRLVGISAVNSTSGGE